MHPEERKARDKREARSRIFYPQLPDRTYAQLYEDFLNACAKRLVLR